MVPKRTAAPDWSLLDRRPKLKSDSTVHTTDAFRLDL
jgi:hypothetical protein